MVKPPRLRTNSLIGLVAPASGPPDTSHLERGRRSLERLGFRVRLGRHLLNSHGYLAGPDEVRAEDLNEMFADETVEAIFCIRGGYGTSRLLPLLDWSALKRGPKIILGYSDITALELAILKEIGLVTFYGPMVTTEMAGTFRQEDRERMLDVLTKVHPPKPIGAATEEDGPTVICPGSATGPLIGGCLSVLLSLLGTPYEPDLDGAILFLEDIDEEPYRLDRYLTQLRLSGKLNTVAGVALGQFVNCEPRRERSSFPVSLSCRQVLQDRLGDLSVPVLSGLGFGHGERKATLPQGVAAALDAQRGFLEILESGVR
jgi:muramoyltetrapeptide carboxypeptidase